MMGQEIKLSASIRLMQSYMKINNLKQKELAIVLGTTESQVCRWLKGRHNPCRAWQMRIGEVLGNITNIQIGKMVRLSHRMVNTSNSIIS